MGICRSKSSMKGKIVLITGGNNGIGFETSLDMANPDSFLGASMSALPKPARTDDEGNPILNPNASARASQNSHYQRQLEKDQAAAAAEAVNESSLPAIGGENKARQLSVTMTGFMKEDGDIGSVSALGGNTA